MNSIYTIINQFKINCKTKRRQIVKDRILIYLANISVLALFLFVFECGQSSSVN